MGMGVRTIKMEKKLKLLLIGGTGGIGSKLHEILSNDFECYSVGSKSLDVTNEKMVKQCFTDNNFDIIIYLSVKNVDSQIHKTTLETVKEQLDVNIIGFINVLRYSTDYLRKQNFGRIIYISSILSNKPIRGTGIYSASKSFCENLVKTYSLENSKYGITSNSIQLGYFDGGLTEKVPNNIMNNVINNIPIKRLGRTNELYNLIKTIISTEYINGTTISITGGYENE